MPDVHEIDNHLIDIKLLRLFDQLFRTRSVTRAAENLGQSQPTVSIWLAKLRELLDDPLFVRTSDGMLPTTRAQDLIPRVQDALNTLRLISLKEENFDPGSTEREFRIGMTDASHITLLPKILAFLQTHAPHSRLEVVKITDETAQMLQDGEIDIAVGLLPGLEAGFFQQVLFPQDWVCLVNADHSWVRNTLSLASFSKAEHIGIVSGTGALLLEAAFKAARIEREIKLRLPGFLGLRDIICNSDLIATTPRHIGETLAHSVNIAVYDCPVEVPGFTVKQHWHERFHRDAGNRWLRNAIATLFQPPSSFL